MKITRRSILIVLGAISLHSLPIEAMTKQVALQKVQEAKAWIANNKGKIIALGLAIAAILGTGYLATKAQKQGTPVDKVFRKHKVELSSDENIQNTQYMLGYTAYEKGLDGLKNLMSKPAHYRQVVVMLQGFKHLNEALAELAGVSVEDFDTAVRYARRNIVLE